MSSRATPFAENSERRLELIGQEANRRLRRGAEGSERMQPNERAVELVEPATTTDDARARIAVNRSRAIERCQQRLRAVAADLAQPQGRAID